MFNVHMCELMNEIIENFALIHFQLWLALRMVVIFGVLSSDCHFVCRYCHAALLT